MGIFPSVWSLGGRNKFNEFFSFDDFGKTKTACLRNPLHKLIDHSAQGLRSRIYSLMSEITFFELTRDV